MNDESNALFHADDAAKSAAKPMGFPIEGKRGKTVLPGILLGDYESALRDATSTRTTSSRTATYTRVICNLIEQYPNEMKSTTLGKKSAMGAVFEKLQEKLFGKGEKVDPTWSTVKSQYHAYYLSGHSPIKEKNGIKWCAPLAYVRDAVMAGKEAPDKNASFLKSVARAIANGLDEDTVATAIHDLEEYRKVLEKGEDPQVKADNAEDFDGMAETVKRRGVE